MNVEEKRSTCGMFKKEDESDHINLLPDELLLIIFQKMDVNCYSANALTCRKWYELYQDRHVFAELFFRALPRSCQRFKKQLIDRNTLIQEGALDARIRGKKPTETELIGKHRMPVITLIVCGHYLVSADKARKVIVRDLKKNEIIYEFTFVETVNTLEMVEKKVFIGMESGSLYVCDLNDESVEHKQIHDRKIIQLQIYEQTLISSSCGDIKILDFNLNVITKFKVSEPKNLCFLAAKGKIFGSAFDNDLQIWDMKTSHLIKTISTPWITSFLELPDGKIVTGSEEGLIQIWDMENYIVLHEFSLNSKIKINSLQYMNEKIVVGTINRAIYIFDLEGNFINQVKSHDEVYQLNLFAPFLKSCNNQIFFGMPNGTIKVYTF